MKMDTDISRKDVLVIVFVLLVAVIGYCFISSMLKGEERSFAGFECPAAGANLLGMALEKKDNRYCGCHEDPDAATACAEGMTDVAVYKNAIEERNPEMCESITDKERKAGCISVIEQDPDYIGHSSCPAAACGASHEGVVTKVEGDSVTFISETRGGEPIGESKYFPVTFTLPEGSEVDRYNVEANETVEKNTTIAVGDYVGVILSVEDDAFESVAVIVNN